MKATSYIIASVQRLQKKKKNLSGKFPHRSNNICKLLTTQAGLITGLPPAEHWQADLFIYSSILAISVQIFNKGGFPLSRAGVAVMEAAVDS